MALARMEVECNPRTRKGERWLIGIEFSNLLAPDTLQILPGESPRLDPFFAERDLFRSPISQGRRLIHAMDLNTFLLRDMVVI